MAQSYLQALHSKIIWLRKFQIQYIRPHIFVHGKILNLSVETQRQINKCNSELRNLDKLLAVDYTRLKEQYQNDQVT